MKLPPAPVGTPFASYTWADWYVKLREILNNTDFNHNDLKNIQGGTDNERYHLTLAEYNKAINAMSIKRIVRGSITLSIGVSSDIYTITPAISNLQKAQLFYLGTSNSPSDGGISITLSNTTTITANRLTSSANATVSFELVEYN